MKLKLSKLFIFLSLLSFLIPELFSANAYAGNLNVLINGKAIHLHPPAGSNYNEKNWGTGLQYDFDVVHGKWLPFLAASGFIDSLNHPSYYAGGGVMYRTLFSADPDSWHMDIGAIAFLMTRQNFKHGHAFPGVLPAVSIGTNRIVVNVSYIPNVMPKMTALFFFQLKVSLSNLM